MWNLNKWILLLILTLTNGYDWKCPHSSQWNLTSRSLECLDQNIYICLLDGLKSNAAKSLFRGICGPKDISREGFKYVLLPDLHQVPCAAGRFQPFTFTTDGASQCVLSKSLCKANGQILANNGNSSIDASCRCDYRQNYDYVIPPKDPCSCKPAEEDCSCYIRKCDDDKFMIADYRCMKRVETILPQDIKCPIISRIIPSEETNRVHKIQLLSVVTDSRTWSKQASVFLIVIIIIYTVLIGFLFFSVPHVTSILLESKIELSVKRKENEFMILNGDNVKIKCNVKSYIPVRSVTWQKEIDGEIIQITTSEDKYKMVSGKRPSLTIDNFNAEDQGKYRCIVRNAAGLRNNLFVSCRNFMSRVGWLTGFETVLQHIPAFHSEDITLHSYDIESQSNPTVYNVFKEDDITMEQHFDDQQKLVAVKWFKESDNWTELDMSNEQYSGGIPDVPSLTIKLTRMGNAGKYFCLLIYGNGKTQKALFKLKIIPEVETYKSLLKHRQDQTIIRPSICDTILDMHMKENNIVVITGREGTGKSKICWELASSYDEKDYVIMKINLSKYTIFTDMVDALLIIDNQHYNQDSLNTFIEHILPVLLVRNIKVIIACRNLDLEIVRRIPEISKLKKEVFIAIDECLTAEEKEKILRKHMKINDIETSSSAESNFRNLQIITELPVQVKLDEDAIKVIRNEEPWKGFPLSASLFCSEKKFLHLGEKYFTNPPRHLVEELKLLYEAARKTSNCIDKINEYCVLVYIMDNKNHQLDLNDHNLCSKLDQLYQTFFNFKKPENHGSNEDQKKSIEEAVHRMNTKYLKFHEGVYEFIHPCLVKAMFLSSKPMVHYLLQNGSLHDITEFVRSEGYTGLENELVIKINGNYHHNLCERLVENAFENQDFLLHVAQYIYSYWRSSGNKFVEEMFRFIEFTLFKSLGVDTGDPVLFDNDSLTEKSINLEGPVQFSKVTVLVDKLTFKGRDPWIYGHGPSDFLILSALVSAAMNRYATDRVETFKIMLQEFENRIHSESFIKLCSKPLDIYGNTFFHYLMGLNQKEASAILSVHTEMKFTFDIENAKKYTPLDIAAFLGKIDIFKVLHLKTSNCTDKLRKKLKRLARSGKDEYFNETFKNKNIDQSVIDKTRNIDDASPAKLENEGADDKQKEEENENNQNKRKLRHKKEESNEKEYHDKKDVLCFEEFIINVVDNGEIDDYQSIIKLFSKKLIDYVIVKKNTAKS